MSFIFHSILTSYLLFNELYTVILFTSGKTVERFIHKMDSMLDEANKLRLRVLVNWDDRVFPANEEFNMKDFFSIFEHFSSIEIYTIYLESIMVYNNIIL